MNRFPMALLGRFSIRHQLSRFLAFLSIISSDTTELTS